MQKREYNNTKTSRFNYGTFQLVPKGLCLLIMRLKSIKYSDVTDCQFLDHNTLHFLMYQMPEKYMS